MFTIIEKCIIYNWIVFKGWLLMILKENTQHFRLGIFVFYNAKGEVHEYVNSMLLSMQPVLNRLVIVSNCKLSQLEKNKLKKFSNEIYIRPNIGLDAAAFKAGIIDYVGWDELCEYDEVVLFNDTFYGPVTEFKNIFSDMETEDIDFWGLAAMYEAVNGWHMKNISYQPAHIQSYFVVFRKSLTNSISFQKYWNSYDDTMCDFVDIVTKHEYVMTKYFQDRGFKWKVYINDNRYKSSILEENFNFYAFIPNQMIQYMRYPLIKRKNFVLSPKDTLYMGGGEELANALEYIHSHTEYDTNQIWDDLLDIYNIYDLYNSLHLNYIFTGDEPKEKRVPHEKVAVVISCEHIQSISYILKYITQIPRDINVYLISGDIEVQKYWENSIELKAMNNISLVDIIGKNTFLVNLILQCKKIFFDYEYVCFVHDVKIFGKQIPPTIGESILYNYFENTLHNENYIDQILNKFTENPKLGLLMTPKPMHHKYFNLLGKTWNGKFERVVDLSKQLGIKCNLSLDKPPIFYG